nr:hypothetical protein [Tanacetum cinerariifolium]
NGDSLVPTRIVEGILQPVAPTTVEQRLAQKNELKARGTLLMAFPDKHQLKFNSHKDAKTLIEAVEKRFGRNTETKKVQKTLLKQQFANFTGSSSEGLDQIHGVSLSQKDVNLMFLCSLPSEWKTHTLIWRNKADLGEQSLDDLFNISAAASVFAACAKLPTSPLPNVDSLSNAVIYSFFASRNLGANGPTSMGFDMSKVECYNCHMKGHFPRECRSPNDSRMPEEELANFALMDFSSNSSSDNETGLKSVEARLLVYKQNESVFKENIKLLNIKVQLRDTALVTLRQKLEKVEQEMDDLKLKLEKFQTSYKNLTDLLTSQTNEKTGFQPAGGYHAVPPPYTGTFMPPKPDLVFPTAPIAVETDNLAFNQIETTILAATPVPASPKSNSSSQRRNRKACFVCKSVDHLIKDCDYHTKKMAQPTLRNYAHRGYHKQYTPLPHSKPQKHRVPTVVLTQSKPVSNTVVRPVSVALPNISMIQTKHTHQVFTKFKSPIRWHITRSPSSRTSNSPPRVTAVQAPVVSAAQGKQGTWGNSQQALKDKEVINSGCSRHMIGNMSYLFKFKEINRGYVTFGGNPKGGKITGEGKIKTGNLVRGLPTKVFENDNTCVACKKGKQHRASCKTKPVSSIDQPLFRLYMDLFVPTFVKSLNKKSYYLVITDDYSRFTWVFFLATKDEISPILKTFITGLENQLSLRVKVIRSDNGTEFKNSDLTKFCGLKGIKREFIIPRTSQQNGIAERKNMTLIEAARTILADLLLPIPFWAEAVNTACYVQNRVTPSIGFVRPCGCPVTVLNTLDPLGKFQGKVDEGFLVGYSVCSTGPTWLFDIDSLTQTMNYQLVNARNQTNSGVSFQDTFVAEKAREEVDQTYVPFPVWSAGSINPQNNVEDAAFDGKEHDFDAKKHESVVILSSSCGAQSRKQDDKTEKEVKGKRLEDITYSNDEDVVGAEADFNNLESSIPEEPKRVHQALKDPSWIKAMQEELFQFKMQKVWVLVDLPYGKRAIGHTQEEGINYEEIFALLARIKAIRLFLAYSSFMGFMVYQIDVKSAFLYRTIEEEVYVYQPPGFEDPDHPDKVYKVVKALYGLHQAPRAWYETLATYLLENSFQRGTIDQTLFIKKQKGDILLVQIYVDDIIFGATNKGLCKSFEKLMKDKFQMSTMGELTFFLGLQVKQKKDGIFISQDKYVADILRKFRLTEGKSASTSIDTEKPLLKDPDGEDVDVHTYRSMIGSLTYLTSLRPDIMFAMCACGCFQVTPKASHLHACKKQTVVATSSIEAEYVAAASCCAQVILSGQRLKKNSKKDKIESKLDKNEKSGEARKSQKQL